MALEEYRRKRDFTQTPEPSGDAPEGVVGSSAWNELPHGRRYCVQMHRATRLHFDFRLEHAGVLLSWAVPRGPSLDPATKRLAVQTEDHPVDYGEFEGVIPGGYGAGTVMLWDIGTFEWVRESAADVEASLRHGDVKFRLSGQKLAGEFALVHVGRRGPRPGHPQDDEKNWLMIKKRDDAVVPGFDAMHHDMSVKTGRSLAQIAADGGGDPRERRRAARAVPQRAAASAPAVPSPATQPDALPRDLPRPMLATSVDRPFTRDGWLFELKYDGVRAMIAVGGGDIRIVGRSGRDETARYPELRTIASHVHARDAILDGEIVVFDDRGATSFERLQSRINVQRSSDIERGVRECPVTFAAFDIVRLESRDLMDTALRIRKKTLQEIIRPSARMIFADHVDTRGEELFEQVRARGGEGIVAKRGDSVYQPGRRSPDWLKIKSWQTQSCVIAGFTAGQGKRKEHLGALILAVYEDGAFVHCGQVGTGFDERMLRLLQSELRPRIIDHSPMTTTPRPTEPATWVRPELVCEVRHAGFTSAGILRHPAFVGLRDDVAPRDCVRETPAQTSAVIAREPEDRGAGDAGGGQRRSGRGGAPGLRGGMRGGPRRAAGAASAGGAQGAEALGSPSSGGEGSPPRQDPRPRRDRASDGDGGAVASDIDEALRTLRTLRGNDHWDIAGRRVALTNLDKVLWPGDGYTKRDMVEYYVRMAPYLLPYLRDRPLSMQVFPDGIEGKSFWRKDKPSHAPEWMDSWVYHGEKTKTYIVVNEVATLAWVANAGVIDLHPWHSRIDAPEQPDWAVFDLDPFEPATFGDVVDIAKMVKAALDYYGLRGLLKTSGQTGLQIYVPLRRGPSYHDVLTWVEEVGKAIGRTDPKRRITWEWTVANRGGKIRIDYTQNIINKTLAAPYSLRPAPGAPVSTPIAWEELDDRALRPDRWTIRTIHERVRAVGDLFAGVLEGAQDLPVAATRS